MQTVEGVPFLSACCNDALANTRTTWLEDGVCNAFDKILAWDSAANKCEVNLQLYENIPPGETLTYGQETKVEVAASDCCRQGAYFLYKAANPVEGAPAEMIT